MDDVRLRIDGSDTLLLSVEITEGLSRPSRVVVRVPCPDEPADADAWLGKPAVVALVEGGEEKRAVAGLVTSVLLALGLRDRHVELVIESRASRLALRTNARTFRELEVADIAKKVLEGAGYGGSDVDVQIGGAPPKRDHVTQYRETDLAFLERMLGEAGVHFVVVTKDDADTIVLTDTDLGPMESDELAYRDAAGLRAGDGAYVSGLTTRRRVRPGKVTLRDQDHTRPKVDLTKTAEAGADLEKTLEVYDFPARTTDDGAVGARAKLLLERARGGRDTVAGETTVAALAPGFRFTLADHPIDALNRELLVTSVSVAFARSGAAGAGANRVAFEAAGVDEPCRPQVAEVARVAPGTQTGFVTGASGKEIHPDDFGRVTYHPHWDREGPTDDKSSPKTRAVQPPLGGSMLTPRVGWEVVVGFVEGDVDQPLILGRMMHGAHPPAYSLPGDKTKLSIKTLTSPGGGSANEIRFNDAKGSEEMFIGASKDATTDVGNNQTEGVKVDETKTVTGNQLFAVTGALTAKTTSSQTIAVGGDQTVGVATYAAEDVGSRVCAVGGARDMKVGGDHKRTVGASSVWSVGGTCMDLVAGTVSVKCLASRTDKIGPLNLIAALGDRIVNVTGARTEDAGAAKLVLAAGSRVVKVKGDMSQTVIGAIGALVRGDRSDTSAGAYKEVAAGAHIIKAANVVIEGKSLVSIVMGASTITLTPGSVSIAGTSIKFNDNVHELGLVADNL